MADQHPKRRTRTDAERLADLQRQAEQLARRQAEREQARNDLLAAVKQRDRLLAELDAEIDRALVAALTAGTKSPELRELLGVSPATFWRRARAAGWKANGE